MCSPRRIRAIIPKNLIDLLWRHGQEYPLVGWASFAVASSGMSTSAADSAPAHAGEWSVRSIPSLTGSRAGGIRSQRNALMPFWLVHDLSKRSALDEFDYFLFPGALRCTIDCARRFVLHQNPAPKKPNRFKGLVLVRNSSLAVHRKAGRPQNTLHPLKFGRWRSRPAPA